MNEIIQSLEADITNGDNNFCMINEKMLLAIKELSKRDYQEKLELKEKTRKQKEVIDKEINFIEKNKSHEYRNGNLNEYYLELNEKEMTKLLEILKEVK